MNSLNNYIRKNSCSDKCSKTCGCVQYDNGVLTIDGVIVPTGDDMVLNKAVVPTTANDPTTATPNANGPQSVLNNDGNPQWMQFSDGTIEEEKLSIIKTCSSISSAAAAGLLQEGQRYKIEGVVTGGNLGTVNVTLFATSNDSLSIFALIETTFDSQSWIAKFDIDTCEIFYVEDRAGNKVYGKISVDSVPWGYVGFTGNQIINSDITLTNVLSFENNIVHGATMTIQDANIEISNNFFLDTGPIEISNITSGSIVRSYIKRSSGYIRNTGLLNFLEANVDIIDFLVDDATQVAVVSSYVSGRMAVRNLGIYSIQLSTIRFRTGVPSGNDYVDNGVITIQECYGDINAECLGSGTLYENWTDIKGWTHGALDIVSNGRNPFAFRPRQVTGSGVLSVNIEGITQLVINIQAEDSTILGAIGYKNEINLDTGYYLLHGKMASGVINMTNSEYQIGGLDMSGPSTINVTDTLGSANLAVFDFGVWDIMGLEMNAYSELNISNSNTEETSFAWKIGGYSTINVSANHPTGFNWEDVIVDGGGTLNMSGFDGNHIRVLGATVDLGVFNHNDVDIQGFTTDSYTLTADNNQTYANHTTSTLI